MRCLSLGLLLLGCISAQSQFITNKGVTISNSTRIYTDGEWINESGTLIHNNGIITLRNGFVNEGILGESGNGKFLLNFAADYAFQPGGGEMRALTKIGLGNALITGSFNVRDSLLIYQGLLELNSSDTLFLKAGGTLAADTGSYVSGGFFARAGSGDMIFPVGNDDHYLPLKLHDMQAAKVFVSVSEAPASHEAGPGVEALIDFPYVWKVRGQAPADTASYVELEYPDGLPIADDMIVVREIAGDRYASMGARRVQQSGLRVKITSYSRRLNGAFTVARGLPTDPVTDSLALVALYQSTNGGGWTTDTNWLTGTIDTWHGVSVNGQSITSVTLPDNNLSGPIPSPLADIISLETIDVSGNEITSLPDFSENTELNTLDVSGNHLTFAALEPNASVPGLSYLDQAEYGTALDTVVHVGTAFELVADAGGQSSMYKWKRGGETVADSAWATFQIPSVVRTNMGDYTTEVTNVKLPGLTLVSRTQRVLAKANVSGTLLVDSTVAAQAGDVTLYKIRPGAFEPIEVVSAQSNGTYRFEDVILGDYQVRGFPDTTLHPASLPTYYVSTILWETADTVAVEQDIDGLDILSQKISTSGGSGSISGTVTEDDGSGRLRALVPVAGAGVSAHFVQKTSPEEEVVTLAAYQFTNEEGAFNLAGLPEGEYKFNIQYPGFPMDESSFTTITIGSGEDEGQVVVEAAVADGKISVRKVSITGIYEEEGYRAEIYPNPAADLLHLNFNEEKNGRTVTLTDIRGTAILSVPAHEKVIRIEIKNLYSGIYILHVRENGHRKKTLKISVE